MSVSLRPDASQGGKIRLNSSFIAAQAQPTAATSVPIRFLGKKQDEHHKPSRPSQGQRNAIQKVKKAPDEFFRQLALMEDVDHELRQQIYTDLRTRHAGFWRDKAELLGKAAAGVVNGLIRLPVFLLQNFRPVVNMANMAFAPEMAYPFSKDEVQIVSNLAKEQATERTQRYAAPFAKFVDPATLEGRIDQSPVISNLQHALDTLGRDTIDSVTQSPQRVITLQDMDNLMNRLEKNPGSFKTQADLKAAQTLVSVFPYFMPLASQADTFSQKTLDQFRQNVKNSIPFLYEAFLQDADSYVESNLYYLGAASTFPDLKGTRKVAENIQQKLNESPTYRRMARWSKENQLSDMQFLPFYSFADAAYGQLVAMTMGFIDSFKMSRVMSQMVHLDGIFNGVGFFIAKFQILYASWEKEKPDRQRAKFEKEIKQLQVDKEQLQQKLAQEQARLAERIQANPAQKEQLEQEFNKTILPAITRQTDTLMQRLEKTTINLEKLLGIRKMGFLEKAWKKPPEYLNDLKIMIPLGLALGIPYELLYFNNYADTPLDFFSTKFMWFMLYGTALSAFGNTITKQIIHLTQDRAKLYQQGAKDELIGRNTPEFLSRIQGVADELAQTQNPTLLKIADELKAYHQKLSLPLLGNTSQQMSGEKAKNREAKLDYSMRSTGEIKKRMQDLHPLLRQASDAKSVRAYKSYGKFLKMLHKIHDRMAYVERSKSLFELELISDLYNKDFKAYGGEEHIPEELRRFFKDTVDLSAQFLKGLQKDYPRAELTYEPLLLKVESEPERLSQIFKQGLTDLGDLRSRIESLAQVFQDERPKSNRLANWLWGKNQRPSHDEKSLAATSFKEQAALIGHALSALKKAEKGLNRNLFYLNAKTKPQADAELAAYKAQIAQVAAQNAQQPFGLQKLQGYAQQTGMQLTLAGKKANYADKYNSWLSGYKWIPIHALLNVVGRFGTVSILKGEFLPFQKILMAYSTNNIPYRIYSFLSEKFLVQREIKRHRVAELTHSMDRGIEHHIQQLKEGQRKQRLLPSGQGAPSPEPVQDPAQKKA